MTIRVAITNLTPSMYGISGESVSGADTSPNYIGAISALVDFFKNGASNDIRIDVVNYEDGTEPVISIAGYPGDDFVSRYSEQRYRGCGGDGVYLLEAVNAVVSPYNVALNPHLGFVDQSDVGFFDASLMDSHSL